MPPLDWPTILAVLLDRFDRSPAVPLIRPYLLRAADHLPPPDPHGDLTRQVARVFDAAAVLAGQESLPARRTLRVARRLAVPRAGAAFAVAIDPRSTSPAPLTEEERAELEEMVA